MLPDEKEAAKLAIPTGLLLPLLETLEELLELPLVVFGILLIIGFDDLFWEAGIWNIKNTVDRLDKCFFCENDFILEMTEYIFSQ